jgi:hypothetical protein
MPGIITISLKIRMTIFLAAAVIFPLIACGCTTQAPVITAPTSVQTTPDVKATAAIPDLTGTWSGTSRGYIKSIRVARKCPLPDEHHRAERAGDYGNENVTPI